MQTQNRELLSKELIQLTQKQIDATERRTYGSITQAEEREYEQRQERIRNLFTELHHLDRAA
jgi:hypothetical protein